MQNKNNNIVQHWIDKANDDLLFANAAFRETKFYEHICFLAEQSVEKYIKAYILKTKGKLSTKDRTHNLIYLSNLKIKKGSHLHKRLNLQGNLIKIKNY